MSCVEAEHDRSANLLRDTNKELLDAINRKTRETGRKSLLKEFRAEQASHVRRRRAACSKAAAGTERLACEADSNFAHLDRLKRFAQ